MASAFHERHLHPVRVDEQAIPCRRSVPRWTRAACCTFEPRPPVIERTGGNLQRHLDRQPMAEPRWRHLGPRKEREIGARMPFSVGVKEVIRSWIVLIHRLLHEPHTEHACVKVEILLSRPGDGRDVVKSVYAFHVRPRGWKSVPIVVHARMQTDRQINTCEQTLVDSHRSRWRMHVCRQAMALIWLRALAL